MKNTRGKKTVRTKHELCKGCGLCVFYCPDKALEPEEGFNAKGYHSVKWKGACSLCGRCYIICPHGAIEIVGE